VAVVTGRLAAAAGGGRVAARAAAARAVVPAGHAAARVDDRVAVPADRVPADRVPAARPVGRWRTHCAGRVWTSADGQRWRHRGLGWTMARMTSTSGLSASARTRLEQELAHVREQREALAPRLSEESMGDAADQADVLERAEVAAWLDRRAVEISDLLAGKGLGEGREALPPGTTVELRYADGETEKLRVIAIAEEAEDDMPTVTFDSPLGKAIAGHAKGDTISYRTPGGQTTAEIVSLSPPG